MNRAVHNEAPTNSIVARCLGVLLLVVMAFVPMQRTSAHTGPGLTGAGQQPLAAALDEDEEDCEELVSQDMVLCGGEYFDAPELEVATLMMPRQQCDEMLERFARALQCDPDDAECRAAQMRRGDLAPTNQNQTRVLTMGLLAASTPALSLQRGVSLVPHNWQLPVSLESGPPPRPPIAA